MVLWAFGSPPVFSLGTPQHSRGVPSASILADMASITQKQDNIKKMPIKRISPDAAARRWIEYGVDQDGFSIKYIDDVKGYGVFATKPFRQHAFLLDYVGELISEKTALEVERKYSQINQKKKYPRCYLYFFKHNQKTMCIDATRTNGRAGSLVNDCVTNENCNSKMKKLIINGQPHLVLFATRNIDVGDEILYDYGDDELWWRKPKRDNNIDLEDRADLESSSNLGADAMEDESMIIENRTDLQSSNNSGADAMEDESMIENRTDLQSSNNSGADAMEDESMIENRTDLQSSNNSGADAMEDESMIENRTALQSSNNSGADAMEDESMIENRTDLQSSNNSGADAMEDESMIENRTALQSSNNSGADAMEDESMIVNEKTLDSNKNDERMIGADDALDSKIKADAVGDRDVIGHPCSHCGNIYHRLCNLIRHIETCHKDINETSSEKVDDFDDLDVIDDVDCDKDYKPDSESDTDYSEDNVGDKDCVSDSDSDSDCSEVFENVFAQLRRTPEQLQKPENHTGEFARHVAATSTRHVDLSEKLKSTEQCREKTKNALECQVSDITSSTFTTADTTQASVLACSNEQSKRIWDKKNYCLFCGKEQSKLLRHFLRKHNDENEVKKLLSCKKGSSKRKMEAEKLRHLGNFYHNAKVLETGEGDFVVVKRPVKGQQIPIHHFVPCAYCKGYYIATELWRHVKSCKLRETEDEIEDSDVFVQGNLKESRKIMEACLNPKIDEQARENLLACMKKDIISLVCRHDQLIILLGSNILMKKGNDYAGYVRTKMRELARLILKVREQGDNDIDKSVCLKDILKPQMFDKVIKAVREECKLSEKMTEFGTPSLALKLGYSLKRCAQIQLGLYIKEKDESGEKCVSNFLKLYEMEYCDKVSSIALETLRTKTQRKTTVLPFTSDIVKFQSYVKNQIRSLLDKDDLEEKSQNFRELAEVTLSHLIAFNKRRSGETSRMLISDYKERVQSTGTHDIEKMLSAAEQQLSSRLMLVHIRGKRGRTVPVIIPPDVQDAMTILTNLEVRKAAGVNADNNFVFAMQRGSVNNIRGWDALSLTVKNAELEHPETFKSTLLRKYVATVSQVLNMNENEMDWLASHLGHDIRIHRQFYRMREEHVELAKVAKLLLAVDKGDIHKYAGKHLTDIDVEDLDKLMEEDEDDSEDDSIEEGGHIKDAENSLLDQDSAATADDDIGPATTDDDIGPAATADLDRVPNTMQRKGKQCVHKSWSSQEKKYLMERFHDNIVKLSVTGIGKSKCEEAIKISGELLKGRTWIHVKSCLKNIITRRKKDLQRSLCRPLPIHSKK